MISVQIIDRHGDECQLQDIIMLHFIAEKIKYLGVLIYDEAHKVFRLSNGDGDWKSLTEPDSTFERLCAYADWPEAEKYLGKINLTKKFTLQKIYDMVSEALTQ